MYKQLFRPLNVIERKTMNKQLCMYIRTGCIKNKNKNKNGIDSSFWGTEY